MTPETPTDGEALEPSPMFDRELSWLSFNDRVLQEAVDPTVPLLERLRFLAIASSNLDEFFRVRVAGLRALLRLKTKKLKKWGINPRQLLREIHRRVLVQQDTFGHALRALVLPELAREGIHLIDETQVAAHHRKFVQAFFDEHVRALVEPEPLGVEEDPPFLKDRSAYLVVALWPRGDRAVDADQPNYMMIEIPSLPAGRFVTLPRVPDQDHHEVMFLDDVIRFNLARMFPDTSIGGAFSVKLSRDADLYLEEEFEGDLVAKIRKSLAKRATGVPSRFLYDLQTPFALVTRLKERLGLEDDDIVPGRRYHNLQDFFSFPTFGRDDLLYDDLLPIPHPAFQGSDSVLGVVDSRDVLLQLPYHSFDPVIEFFDEAAADPMVDAVWASLYRIPRDSAVASRLIEAVENGKEVTAFVEVQARFDEESNLEWADRMVDAGVRVLFSRPGIKVHTKLALVARRREGKRRLHAYLGTGNFNEKTARVYADLGLFTSDRRLTEEVLRVFEYLGGEEPESGFEHLLVAPIEMRERFRALVEAEMTNARAGEEARMILKMNSLEDSEMIELLYDASRAGVDVDIIVRGICRLVPGVPGVSERIRVRSIVDRYLEHARAYVFHNGGDPLVFAASADWMTRNLDRRVEVAFPIYDEGVRAQITDMLSLQLADNVRARIIDAEQVNQFVRGGAHPVRAQIDLYAKVAVSAVPAGVP